MNETNAWNPYWAPVDFTHTWGFVGFLIVLIWALVGDIYARIALINAVRDISISKENEILVQSLKVMYCIFPDGYNIVYKDNSSRRILISKDMCCGRKKIDISDFTCEVKRCPFTVSGVLGVVVGQAIGFFIFHFIPCIWWTCDWGEHDGEQVRGIVWMVMTPAALMLLLYKTHCVEASRYGSKLIISINNGRSLFFALSNPIPS